MRCCVLAAKWQLVLGATEELSEAEPICVVQVVIIFVRLVAIFVGGCRWRISLQLCVAVVLVVIKVVLLLEFCSFPL